MVVQTLRPSRQRRGRRMGVVGARLKWKCLLVQSKGNGSRCLGRESGARWIFRMAIALVYSDAGGSRDLSRCYRQQPSLLCRRQQPSTASSLRHMRIDPRFSPGMTRASFRTSSGHHRPDRTNLFLPSHVATHPPRSVVDNDPRCLLAADLRRLLFQCELHFALEALSCPLTSNHPGLHPRSTSKVNKPSTSWPRFHTDIHSTEDSSQIAVRLLRPNSS